VPAREIAEKSDVPYRFLEQVLRDLKNLGLIKSIRGPYGGYKLIKKASSINLLYVVEAINGPIEIVPCLQDPADCRLLGLCAAHNVWCKVDKGMKDTLRSVTFDRLVSKEALGNLDKLIPGR
jgi:Rrf2 family protein